MSNRCVHCNEAWDYDDCVCPVCDCAAVEQDSNMGPTLEYKTWKCSPEEKKRLGVDFTYDVIRISIGKSIWGDK